jgi:hypothetical protein
MDITLALDRDNRRDLRMFAGDEQTINLVVYAVDGDDTPIVVTDAAIITAPLASVSFPVGSQFTVPDDCERVAYRLTADVDGTKRTLCYGMIVVQGAHAWPYFGFDYGGAWAWGIWP